MNCQCICQYQLTGLFPQTHPRGAYTFSLRIHRDHDKCTGMVKAGNSFNRRTYLAEPGNEEEALQEELDTLNCALTLSGIKNQRHMLFPAESIRTLVWQKNLEPRLTQFLSIPV